ncbi:MAG: hypothetical protein JO319_15065 [Acidobacteriaceae bacterium]|nr:hypothetical protein [Acidobacteriaceae bacterium]
MKDEEFIADFCLVAKRTLSEIEHKVFKFHFLLGADWKLCSRRLNIDRGTFFHVVYRIEEKLGRTFRELQPYALFPVDEYFNGTPRNTEPEESEFKVETEPAAKPRKIWKYPVKKAA